MLHTLRERLSKLLFLRTADLGAFEYAAPCHEGPVWGSRDVAMVIPANDRSGPLFPEGRRSRSVNQALAANGWKSSALRSSVTWTMPRGVINVRCGKSDCCSGGPCERRDWPSDGKAMLENVARRTASDPAPIGRQKCAQPTRGAQF
jgi:hypothetical protein